MLLLKQDAAYGKRVLTFASLGCTQRLAGRAMCADPPLDRGSHRGYWYHWAPAGGHSVCAGMGLVTRTRSVLCPIIFVFAL